MIKRDDIVAILRGIINALDNIEPAIAEESTEPIGRESGMLSPDNTEVEVSAAESSPTVAVTPGDLTSVPCISDADRLALEAKDKEIARLNALLTDAQTKYKTSDVLGFKQINI